MVRVNVIVEGQTEESFIENILARHFWPHAIYITPFVLGIPGHKGGNVKYSRVKKDVLLQLKQDRAMFCSTMLDLYGLGDGFPSAHHLAGAEKAQYIEQAMSQDIYQTVPELRPDHRFIPYLQVHEYEGLLFSDPGALASAVGRSDLAEQFGKVRAAFTTPEDINDNPHTAPSKRILGLYPAYKKVIEGTIAAETVGLDNMLRECPHFRGWVNHIRSLAA